MGNMNLPEPLIVKLPMKSPNAQGRNQPGIVEQSWPIMLPHELIACMYVDYPQEFAKYILGPQPLADFWAGMRHDDPRLRSHPVTRVENFRERAVPMKLHGDGVPVGKAKGRSLDVITLSSLVSAPGPTWDSKLLLFLPSIAPNATQMVSMRPP